jgi:hypothetical protein
VEANELPLALRRQQLSLQYITKLHSNPANPAFNCVFKSGFTRLFEARPHVIPTLCLRLHQSISDSGITLTNIARYSITQFPTWVLKAPEFQFSLLSLGSKSDVSPTVYQAQFKELASAYIGYTRIFTDGSKIGEAAGAAAILASHVSNKRLPNHSSIFTAESRAILLALEMAQRFASKQFLFLSDSLSCLQSPRSRDLSQPLIAEILYISSTILCGIEASVHVVM